MSFVVVKEVTDMVISALVLSFVPVVVKTGSAKPSSTWAIHMISNFLKVRPVLKHLP